MILCVFLQVFANLCLYFSVISAFPYLFACQFTYLWAAFACAAGIAVAAILSRLNGKRWDIPGIIGGIIPFVLAGSLMDYFVLLPPLCYVSIIIARQMYSMEYFSYRTQFKFLTTGWCCFFVWAILVHTFETMRPHAIPTVYYVDPLRYFVVYFICSVFILRQLRLDSESTQGRRLNQMQMLLSAGSLTGILVSVVFLEKLARNHTSSLIAALRTVLNVLYSVLFLPATLMAVLVSDRDHTPFTETTEAITGTTEAIETSYIPLASDYSQAEEVVQEAGFPWWVAIGILLALSVCLFFIARLLRQRTVVAETEEVRQKLAPQPRRKRRDTRSNRAKIRAAYRSFLTMQKRSGVTITKSDTSLDVLGKLSENADPAEAKKLRDVYLRARYDETSEPDGDALEKAQDALKKILK